MVTAFCVGYNMSWKVQNKRKENLLDKKEQDIFSAVEEIEIISQTQSELPDFVLIGKKDLERWKKKYLIKQVITMVHFKQSICDSAWICTDCGVAVYPTPENINEHINDCKSD